MYSIRDADIDYLASLLGNGEHSRVYAQELLTRHDDNLDELDGMILTPLDQVLS